VIEPKSVRFVLAKHAVERAFGWSLLIGKNGAASPLTSHPVGFWLGQIWVVSWGIRACSDKRLTGTGLRVLGVIGFHDRRSIARGAGAGCFAGQRLIAQRAGLDRKDVRQSIERLVTLGYLDRTERASEKGGYVLRVIEVDPDAPAENDRGCRNPLGRGRWNPLTGGLGTP
jgi:hypothetical protein